MYEPSFWGACTIPACKWELCGAESSLPSPSAAAIPHPVLSVLPQQLPVALNLPSVLCCQNDVSMTCTSDLVSLQLQLSVFPHCIKSELLFPLCGCLPTSSQTAFPDWLPPLLWTALAGASVPCEDSGCSFLPLFCLILPNPCIPPQKSRPLLIITSLVDFPGFT